MRGVHAAIFCLLAALALSGCASRSEPVVAMQPRSDLDSLAYGRPYVPVAYATAPMPATYDAAYRLGAGARTDAGAACVRHQRPATRRLHPRPLGGGRDRSLSAILYSRR